MALDESVVNLIRDEIGNDTDFVDNDSELTGNPGELGSLEAIYTDENRGDSNPLRTALIVWRRRLWSLQNRSFDVTTEGTLLNRRQRVAYVERRIKELELLVDTTNKGTNMNVQQGLTSGSSSDGASPYPEFS